VVVAARDTQLRYIEPMSAPSAKDAIAQTPSAELSPTSSESGRTNMRCLGTIQETRQCYFLDLYYHIPSGQFHYYGIHGDTPKAHGHTAPKPDKSAQQQVPEEQWLALARCVHGNQWKALH
jgi:hypothetical protein